MKRQGSSFMANPFERHVQHVGHNHTVLMYYGNTVALEQWQNRGTQLKTAYFAWEGDWWLQIFGAVSPDSAWLLICLFLVKNELGWALEDDGSDRWRACVCFVSPPQL